MFVHFGALNELLSPSLKAVVFYTKQPAGLPEETQGTLILLFQLLQSDTGHF